MKINRNNAGFNAEQMAETFLKKNGLKLHAKNYHCPHGEIDLIMQEKETLVFVEVRLRTNAKFGSAADSITYQKQQKLVRTAQHYLQQHSLDMPCRFDGVLLSEENFTKIEWVRNAFETH